MIRDILVRLPIYYLNNLINQNCFYVTTNNIIVPERRWWSCRDSVRPPVSRAARHVLSLVYHCGQIYAPTDTLGSFH